MANPWNFTARGKYAADVLQALRDSEKVSDADFPSQLAGSVAMALEVFASNALANAPEDKLWEVTTQGEMGVSYDLNITLVADPNAQAAKEAKAKEQGLPPPAKAPDHSASSTPSAHSSGRK